MYFLLSCALKFILSMCTHFQHPESFYDSINGSVINAAG